jgi:hypothetical protein
MIITRIGIQHIDGVTTQDSIRYLRTIIREYMNQSFEILHQMDMFYLQQL